jgi:hypothetical protein
MFGFWALIICSPYLECFKMIGRAPETLQGAEQSEVTDVANNKEQKDL